MQRQQRRASRRLKTDWVRMLQWQRVTWRVWSQQMELPLSRVVPQDEPLVQQRKRLPMQV